MAKAGGTTNRALRRRGIPSDVLKGRSKIARAGIFAAVRDFDRQISSGDWSWSDAPAEIKKRIRRGYYDDWLSGP